MSNNTIYKEYIRKFNKKLDQISIEEIFYRIININNKVFFAQELATGAIFPIYYFSDDCISSFNSHSYVKTGKYYVYCALTNSKKIFEYCIDENDKEMKKCSIEEINHYLKLKSNNERWNKLMKKYEQDNFYYFPIETIKEQINIQKSLDELNKDNEKEEIDKIYIEESDLKINYTYTPCINIKAISEYGFDMSSIENPDNLIIRKEEIKQIIKSTAIKNKSILLVGPPGCGKTGLVSQLAQIIKQGKSKWLENKMIFNVIIQTLLLNTKYRGQFEEKLQDLINFCVTNKNKIILFIDEIHNLYGLGSAENSPTDAMNILKPYLCSNSITIIGATTDEEYQKHMINDPAFLERFEIYRLSPIEKELNIQILLSYINDLETKYKIKLSLNENQKTELIKYILEITDKKNQRIINDDAKLSNPRISKSILEEAFVETLYNDRKEVTINDICFAIISCNRLSPTYRKEKAEELKTKLINSCKNNNTLKLALANQN